MANTITMENKLQKEIIRHLNVATIIYPFASTKYEGELKKSGDTVTVQMMPSVTWTTGATAGGDIAITDMTMTKENFQITKVAVIGYKIADIEKVRANIDVMSELAANIAIGRAELVDSEVISNYTNALTANKLHESAAVTLTKANIYSYLEEMSVQLDTQNVPSENRVLFVTPANASLIRQAPEFDGTKEGLDVRLKGFVGMMSGFKILKTNNAPANHLVAFDRNSINMVAQMTKFKITDSPNGFYAKLLWEMVYDSKVFAENSKRIVTCKHT